MLSRLPALLSPRVVLLGATVFACQLAVACAAGPAPPVAPPPAPTGRDAEERPPPTRAAISSNQLGFDLYLALARTHAARDNLVFSPLSASAALGMTLAGARGETELAMRRVLHLEAPREPHAELGALLTRLGDDRAGDAIELHVANRLWGSAR